MENVKEYKQLLTVDDVAALIGQTRASVYAHIKRNKIPHFKGGLGYRFEEDAVQAWMRGEDVSEEVTP